MAFQWVATDPNGAQAPPAGYSGPYYYQKSAPPSPYNGQVLLPGHGMPTPPVAVSPLPAGPVWLPYYSPGKGPSPLPSPNQRGGVLPGVAATVLIDILHPRRGSTTRITPHILYDVRDYPETAVVSTRPTPTQLSDAHLAASITSPPVSNIKIISKAFPWEIDVDSGDDSVAVTVGDLLAALHDTLQKHITGSEWWIVTDQVREKVSTQYVKNCDQSGAGSSRHKQVYEKERKKEEGLRRVDWLLDNIIMHGLERDDQFASLRFRDRETRDKTWVLVTGSK